MARLEDLLLEKNLGKCPDCGGKLEYKYSGIYECVDCHKEVYDDFGKVKKYIEEHGPAPANEISQQTGVAMNVINKFLRKGRVEIPEGSGFYITCEICGTPIRFGRFCLECAVKRSGGDKKAVLMDEAGERVKGKSDKMHYLGDSDGERTYARQRRSLPTEKASAERKRSLPVEEKKTGERRSLPVEEKKTTERRSLPR